MAAGSTDAVNGGQLFATNTTISNLGNSMANGLGGGSSYDPTTGTVTTALNYGGNQYSSVQGVIDQIGGSLNGGGIKYFHANSTKGDSQANGPDSIAVGPNAVATAAGTGAIALGLDSNASATGAMAIGQFASARGANGIAMGVSAVSGATGQNVAIGAGASANAATAGGGAVSIGLGNTAQGDGAVAIGDPNTAIGTGAVAMGANNTANGQGAVALGNTSTATGQGSFAAGNNSNAGAAGAVALGDTALGAAANTVAVGSGAKANNANDVALGSGSTTAAVVNTTGTTIAGTAYTFAGTNATSTVSVGTAGAERTVTNVAAGQITATSTDAVNGSQLYATNQAVQAVGQQVTQLADDAVQYDARSNKSSITLGGANGTTISNVANGTVTATSTDAVNGSQLYAVQQLVGAGWNLSTNGGTATNVAPNGNVDLSSADGNMVISQTGTQVKFALSDKVNVANSISVGKTTMTASGISVGGTGGTSITKDGMTVGDTTISGTGLTIANGGPSITTSGIYAGKQKITGVGAGTIYAASTDAVNGSQLYGTAQSVATALGGNSVVKSDGTISRPNYTVGGKTYNSVGTAITALDSQFNGIGNSISNLQSQISHNQNEARSGIAQAMAASALRYDDRPGKISAAAGMSVYHSQVGIAAGIGWTSEDAKWRANLAGTYSPGARKPDFGVMGGLSYTFN
ncbi:YadA family autotransporter adhesin [Labrys okinawensis]|uniref:YadA family autotransporter adhesin n=1 Tax=Labrys okinawensis TaxID=346911 RepID=UPI0039BC95CB